MPRPHRQGLNSPIVAIVAARIFCRFVSRRGIAARARDADRLGDIDDPLDYVYAVMPDIQVRIHAGYGAVCTSSRSSATLQPAVATVLRMRESRRSCPGSRGTILGGVHQTAPAVLVKQQFSLHVKCGGRSPGERLFLSRSRRRRRRRRAE